LADSPELHMIGQKFNREADVLIAPKLSSKFGYQFLSESNDGEVDDGLITR